MERNQNPQTVTLAVELYDELVRMAKSPESYNPKRITRHARKFNPHMQMAHQARVRELERLRTKRINQCREILNQCKGKVVFVETSVNYGSKPLKDLVFTPMIVKRINRERRDCLDVYKLDETKFGHYNKSTVTPNCVSRELPDDYYQICFGVYRTLWVKRGSPMHRYAIEEEAHEENWQRDEYKRKQAEPTDLGLRRIVQRVDVMGER